MDKRQKVKTLALVISLLSGIISFFYYTTLDFPFVAKQTTSQLRTQSQGLCVAQKTFGKYLPITALASYPGSGNTWMRYLLEETTGIYTGGIYHSIGLIRAGFFGEGRVDGGVVAVKTHLLPKKSDPRVVYERAIVLMRNPADSLLAEFNRRHVDKTGSVQESVFETEAWRSFVARGTKRWLRLYLSWFNTFDRPIHVVRYESLKEDLEATLWETLTFLNVDVNQTTLKCVLNNSQGHFHRPHRQYNVDPFTEQMRETFHRVKTRVEKALERRLKQSETRIQQETDLQEYLNSKR